MKRERELAGTDPTQIFMEKYLHTKISESSSVNMMVNHLCEGVIIRSQREIADTFKVNFKFLSEWTASWIHFSISCLLIIKEVLVSLKLIKNYCFQMSLNFTPVT